MGVLILHLTRKLLSRSHDRQAYLAALSWQAAHLSPFDISCKSDGLRRSAISSIAQSRNVSTATQSFTYQVTYGQATSNPATVILTTKQPKKEKQEYGREHDEC
jgi:site-specific recombinase XerD